MTCELLHRTGCGWCGKQLTGRQKRWCSRRCGRNYRINHRWTDAKEEARKRAAWYACARCEYLFQQHDINVDHITPCLGNHNRFGCWHHQTNLRILCVDCHTQVTAEQRANGDI